MSEEVSKQFDEKYCSSCGKPMKIAAELCPNCGVRALSDKKWIATLLLFIFLPSVHRFYVGKIGIYKNKNRNTFCVIGLKI